MPELLLPASSLGDSPPSFCSFPFPQSKSIKHKMPSIEQKTNKEMQPSKSQAKVHLAWDEYWTMSAGSENFSEGWTPLQHGPCHLESEYENSLQNIFSGF